ncbi:MAG: helix-turn-helix domain-containing protein [Pseudomonadota bacterium]
MNAKLSETLYLHRKKSGLTQQELAALAGVGKNLIYQLEHGKQTVRFDILLKILNILNIEIDFRSPLSVTCEQERINANS